MIDFIKNFFKKEEDIELEIVEDYGDAVLVRVKERKMRQQVQLHSTVASNDTMRSGSQCQYQ